MQDLEVGDRVLCETMIDGNDSVVGKTGTVVKITLKCGVCFDEDVHGHALDGDCQYGYGWYIHKKYLKKITNDLQVELI